MFESQPLSIEFWNRLLSRLEADFLARRQSLRALLTPKAATVETLSVVLGQTARMRNQAVAELNNLENLQLLIQAVSSQVRQVSFDVGIPTLEQQISTVRNIISVFEEYMCGLPSRVIDEEDINHAATQYTALRSSGTGEAATTERQRLRSITRELRVFGSEDSGEYETSTRNMQTTLDQWDADLQSLRVSTLLSVRVTPELAELLSSFGVAVYEMALPPAEEGGNSKQPEETVETATEGAVA
ncbi:uncharacterized protein NMK_1942 [Novimethylophilus kurashikiensis]|uniref:Uncharacterized protein n=1 Tax=Novimethylophilus kurashikiensis TaxID=1825523 RepID=A0A2R5FBR0_9PROT|nr:hypothetical protein [Novimethylophilus kurashikiensis]GBG14343.1 uncharacterized protein NMK_1942 [Novimethylophilus kurashikiensis]